MTIELTDRTEMAESGELDDMFERVEQMHIPEGYKVEIVEGTIYMAPQRGTHWETIADIYEQLRTRYPRKRVLSDVRIDFPGHLNGFASDLVALAEEATKNDKNQPRYQDIEFVAEVISESTGKNDYGPKKTAYALAEVPVYLIADPYLGRCRVFTDPQDGDYKVDITVAYGMPIDLTHTVVGITLSTAEFPRD
ncbi:Endonuclease, Uma2 family (restriction endonuclease fold) [Streptomyces sp. 2224.1]|uniref:Uma2 family endonuclease n=1 Tax=unclassified Streptomyces TaxID=2593676 RepID=UPI00088BB4DF|nr:MULTISPECIES: Uma2 family endonuclease [unclassified Streptomyces]PBC84530.1 Uma2 family endonuclease [Streptomyces sp. 2321.6]SDR29457.1 Endonuclease, Uma2 family (restriction endonuclease fold) [Streptomyces sp. KS_16]SEB68408.1 Endonuclease, Uma2 family (restriction endonuclease fold) [Streptomyces sp. 2224.1]SED34737.1 Endonuclease, Uma2 family (restriction endonuclease fold) [Streptomyces sp. 2133.1]SEE48994.1 Endonuclease, Uma2 family (restriction endonuclease fold) [Streptomyces sp. 